ncbi:Flp pilus assembly complex ATPase component TadA [Pseudomonas cichorii]|nr:ATPase, T2SS/T4P/T4SS family [Pseudomonas cichorii]MBX8493162.1 Flp pilus assembly complex ATPase component TadA [Pseudomonas cichorii]
MKEKSIPFLGWGMFARGPSKKPINEGTALSSDQLVATVRGSKKFKLKADAPPMRSVLTQGMGVVGNDLSHIVVGDLGNREAVILVSEQSLGQSLHVDTRELVIKAGYTVSREHIADVSLIVDINNAINGQAADTKASDAGSVVHELIQAAIDDTTSDIHLCNREHTGMAMFRVHSNLYRYRSYDAEIGRQMVGYLYTQMADQKTRSKGTFSLEAKSMSCVIPYKFKGTSYKLRFKYIRLVDGWDMIMRVLPVETQNEQNITYADLGFEVSQRKLLAQCVSRSIGLIALLGPTNSGKSTTLKTCMEADPNRMQRKRYSVEDPVEYKIFGTSQISVQRDDHEEEVDSIKALNGILRDILRGDPDEVLIGEVRDASTAAIMADFILTGHKVYTSIHTSSAFGAILRLVRLGLDRHVLADQNFFSALVFQRLLPVLCDHCKVPASEVLTSEKLHVLQEKFGIDPGNVRCSAQGDCQHCKGRGIASSTAVAEIVAPDKNIRHLIAEGRDEEAELYWRRSRKSGYNDADMTGKTAYEHALYKVSQGWIDPRDLEREFEPLESYERVEVSL